MKNTLIKPMFTSTVSIIRDNLHDRYDSGFPILKELIQNANDSGAHKVIITKSMGIEKSSFVMLRKKALLVYNDGIVSDDDIEGLVSVAQGGKTGRKGVIGKFGLGMKSIFHFADMFFYLAFRNGDIETSFVNPFIDGYSETDKYHTEWNAFDKTNCDLLEIEAVKNLKEVMNVDELPKNGLLLWIPLRDGSYEHTILKDCYDVDNIWGMDSGELKKSIALSLISLDISTPCNDNSRSIESITVENNNNLIELDFPIGSNIVKSEEKDYCSFIKSKCIENSEGEKLLDNLIKQDCFSELSYIDKNDNEKVAIGYDKNQKVATAIIKFSNEDAHNSINFNWCCYLPLDSNSDIRYPKNSLDCEYHILAHAHFSIDSGRKSIVNFDQSVNSSYELNMDSIKDEKSAQGAWNFILLRYYILPEILNFASFYEEQFIIALYEMLCRYDDEIGFFCLDKGFAYKERNGLEERWNFKKTSDIKETAYGILNKANEYFSNTESLQDKEYYKLLILIAKYINSKKHNINWGILEFPNIKNYELTELSIIALHENTPILFIPEKITDIPENLFIISDSELVINFLLCVNQKKSEKIGELFALLCKSGCIDGNVCAEIYSNPMVRGALALFALGKVNAKNSSYTTTYKTYDEVCKICNDSRLFSSYGVTEKNNIVQLYSQIFNGIELYIIGGKVAKSQLFLQENKDEQPVKYSNDNIEVLNKDSLEAVLFSMSKHEDMISYNETDACTRFIQIIQNNKTESFINSYKNIIRDIIIGKRIDDYQIYTIEEDENKLSHVKYYINIFEKYTQSNINDHVIDFNIEITRTLCDQLDIAVINCSNLEDRLGNEYYSIRNCSNDEKLKLAELIEKKSIYEKLPIHETIYGDFVSINDIEKKYFLENEKEVLIPSGYKLPDKYVVLKVHNKEKLQANSLKLIKPTDLANIILTDENINLSTPNSIIITNYLHGLFRAELIDYNILFPKAKDRRWIPDNNYNYYSLKEIISNEKVNLKILSKCKNLTLLDSMDEKYKISSCYVLKDDDDVLNKIIDSNDGTWPWFNIYKYKALSEEKSEKILELLNKTEDPLFSLLQTFNWDSDEIIKYCKNSFVTGKCIEDVNIIRNNLIKYLLNICSSVEVNSEIQDYVINHIKEIFIELGNTNDFLIEAKNAGNICLPSAENKWQIISELVNFETDIPDLKDKNKLHPDLSVFFNKQKTRFGDTSNVRKMTSMELINMVDQLENKKLWGVFCFCIFSDYDRSKLQEKAELIEDENSSLLRKKSIRKKIKQYEILLHTTKGNYCQGLTDEKVNLTDSNEIVTLFYNKPDFDIDNGLIKVELFDNFQNFKAAHIEKAIKELFEILEIHEIDQKFYDELARPDQVNIEKAINVIFNNIPTTLKQLHLTQKAGKFNQIAENWQDYMVASGENNQNLMRQCLNNIKTLICSNDGNVQEKIRKETIEFIRKAEYQENCILFELFQNADDAYKQSGSKSDVPYFKVTDTYKKIKIEHCGRPINQYKVGSLPEYRFDLVNMLAIGWSDKSYLNSIGAQTGKYGYGFKTVYLICDEPHVISGEYNFLIKGGLYPDPIKIPHGYRKETVIELLLNENGINYNEEIINSFHNAAPYQILFSKAIKKIVCPYLNSNNKIESDEFCWEPSEICHFENNEIQIDENFLLFILKDNKKIEKARIAFRRENNKIIPFDEKAPKVWNMAPLLDNRNMGFAISADFKTNTGRQTLAQNQDKCLLSDISDNFSDLLLKIYNDDKCGSEEYEKIDLKSFLPSLINTLFIGTLRTADNSQPNIFRDIPLAVLERFKNKGYIPDGIDNIIHYEEKEIFSISKNYFYDSFSSQCKYVKIINNYLGKILDINMYVITETIASEIRKKTDQYKNTSFINLIDILLARCETLDEQKKILIELRKTDLYNFILQRNEKLTDCSLYNKDNELESIRHITELSEDYDEVENILKKLFTIDYDIHREAIKSFNKNEDLLDDNEDTEDFFDVCSDNFSGYNDFEEVFNLWKTDVDNYEWEDKLNIYYDKLYPRQLSKENLKELLTLTDDEQSDYIDNEGTMPINWCVFILIAMCQSIRVWGHSEVSNKLAIEWLYEKHLITDFCNGENLEKLYDKYLNYASSDESYLRQFEMLLRLYKIRSNFCTFYSLMSGLPLMPNLNDIGKILDSSINEDLTGLGIEMPSCLKTLRFGISLIIRELLLCGFWNNENIEDFSAMEKFAYTPSKTTCFQILNKEEKSSNRANQSIEIFNNLKDKLENMQIDEEIVHDFLGLYDLPLIIYSKEA